MSQNTLEPKKHKANVGCIKRLAVTGDWFSASGFSFKQFSLNIPTPPFPTFLHFYSKLKKHNNYFNAPRGTGGGAKPCIGLTGN